jgi:uncharacterized protein (TIGR02996 family)
MPTDREELVKNILAAPEDDDLRLVFADWLEEHGEADRANLIRYQCTAAKVAPWERSWQESTWRAEALIEEHGDAWRTSELPALDGIEWKDFERGFVSTVRVRDVAALYAHDAEIGKLVTVSCVEVPCLDESGTVRPADSVPWLQKLRLTSEGEDTIAPKGSLLSAPSILEIVRLDDDQVLSSLLDWMANRGEDKNAGRALVQIKVEGNHTAGMAFVRDFVEAGEAAVASGQPANLRRLDLGTRFIDYDSGYFEDPTIGSAGAQILADAHSLRALEAIDVSRQRVGNEGLSALVAALPRLHELHARHVQCDDVAFLQGSTGAALDRLDLSGNAFGDAGAQALSDASRLATLKTLDLDTCEIGPQGVRALTTAPFWQTLRRLDISRNPIGERLTELLVQAAPPAHLHTLALADVDIGGSPSTVVEALAGITWIRRLLSLDLSKNDLGDFDALRRFEGKSLRKLSLARTGFGTAHAASLSTLWKQLWHLDLSRNPLGDHGLITLVANCAEELQVLDLRHCGITSSGLSSIANHASSFPRLRDLRLGGNALDADSVARLLDSPLMDRLRVLDLSGCSLEEDAVNVLTRSPRVGRLRVLNLRRNQKISKSVIQLAKSESLRSVPKVYLHANAWQYDDETRSLLLDRFGHRWWYHSDEEPEALSEEESTEEGNDDDEDEEEEA